MHYTRNTLLLLGLTLGAGGWGYWQLGELDFDHPKLRELEVKSARLEAKSARLEDDWLVAISARDAARQKVNALEEQRLQLLQQIEQLQRVARERDALKLLLAQRTGERDFMQANLTQFGRDLQNLAARVEQAANLKTDHGVAVAAGEK